MLVTVLIIVLILMLCGAFPRAGSYNESWGYAPSGLLGTVLIIIIVLILLGRL